MTTRQENKFSMYLVVRDFCTPNLTVLNAIPNFGVPYANFIAGIATIQQYRNIQEMDTTGVAKNKDQLKNSLIDLTLEYSQKLVALAASAKNIQLEKEVTYTLSTLQKSADTILKDRGQLIYNKVNEHLAELAAYEIDASTQAAFLNVINAYEAAIPQPSLSKNDSKLATANIDDTFTKMDVELVVMDKLLVTIKKKDPDLHSGYENARVVSKAGVGSLALKGLVKDINGLPLANVKIEISPNNVTGKLATGSSAKPILKKKTTDKGNFQEKNFPDGSYTMTLSKNDFKTLVVNFTVTAGEMTKLEVIMESAV